MRQLFLLLFALILFTTASFAQSSDSNYQSSLLAAGPAASLPGAISISDRLREGEPLTIKDFVDKNKQLRQSVVPQPVKNVFTKTGHQHAELVPGHPLVGKVVHWVTLSIATSGTIADGTYSRKIIEDIVQDKQTGAVTVICEANPLFKASDGCGVRDKKLFLIDGGAAIGGSEAVRPYCAACADLGEVFIGVIGWRNMATGKQIINRSIVIGKRQ